LFTPERKKRVIKKSVEAGMGSKLEDLNTATWIAYGFTHSDPTSEAHQIVVGVISGYELHQLGWSTSKLIPSSTMLEGEDETLDERITAYCDIARKHKDELYSDLLKMLGVVYLLSRNRPEDLMHQWLQAAMKRHDMSPDLFTEKNPFYGRVVMPGSKQVQ
jgi:hypothetical protein